MTERLEAVDPRAGTPGGVLAAAREAAGLTTADVAGQMRISQRQVEAIEADRYDQLPGAVFVRGFVRNYARLLNLDAEPLLHALEPALGGEVPLRAQHYEGAMPDSRRGSTRIWLALFLMVLAVVLGAAAYEYWRGKTGSESRVDTPGATPDKGKGVAPAPASPGTSVPVAEPVPLAPERLTDAAPATTLPAPAEASAPASASASKEIASPPAAAPGTARLQIEFVRDSWIEVREKDGRVVFSGTGPAGSTQSLDGKPPLEIIVGNASGVRITYNRRPIDVEARATRNIARFTLE